MNICAHITKSIAYYIILGPLSNNPLLPGLLSTAVLVVIMVVMMVLIIIKIQMKLIMMKPIMTTMTVLILHGMADLNICLMGVKNGGRPW